MCENSRCPGSCGTYGCAAEPTDPTLKAAATVQSLAKLADLETILNVVNAGP